MHSFRLIGRLCILLALAVAACCLVACQVEPTPVAVPVASITPSATAIVSSATPVPPSATSVLPTSTGIPPTPTPRPTNTFTPLPPDVPQYQLVYAGDDDCIYVGNSDGSGIAPITSAGFGSPAWSPAANLLAVAGKDGNDPAIFTLRLDGSKLTTLFRPPAASKATNGWRIDAITEIHWSADGRWLVFASERSNGAENDPYWTGTPNLHRISAQGAAFETFPQHTIAGDAAWAPQGNSVAYTDGIGPDIWGIKVTNFDSGQTLIFKAIPLTAGDGCGRAAWAPDGMRLSFMCKVKGKVALYVVNADGTNPVELVAGIQDYRQWSAWSPDGAWIAFTDGRDLWKLRPDASDKTLWIGNIGGGPLQWSPDGTRLAFYSHGDLYVTFADSRYAQKIAAGLADINKGDAVFAWISGNLP